MDKDFLTVKEVAEVLKVGVATVYRILASGELSYTVIGKGSKRIERADLEAYLTRQKETCKVEGT